MSNMKRSMRRVFWLLALCFFLLLGYLCKIALIDGDEISGNAYNHRLRYVDETARANKCGKHYGANKYVLIVFTEDFTYSVKVIVKRIK